MAVKDGRLGMPMDVQVGRHDSTVHAQGFSCQKREQMIMTSLGDVTVMVLMYIGWEVI